MTSRLDLLHWVLDAAAYLPNGMRTRRTIERAVLGQGGDYVCPLCSYRGPFDNVLGDGGLRLHCACPRCGSAERHRVQWVVWQRLLKDASVPTGAILHLAPERGLAALFRDRFRLYVSADLSAPGVTCHADLTSLPFANASFDAIHASHVLEHVRDDVTALAEMRRVLRPGGIAALPVPILGKRTVEYGAPNPGEGGHVRAPGVDYFERLSGSFTSVQVYSSDEVPPEYQPYLLEDRSAWPSRRAPRREASPGARHPDYVPICRV